MELYNQKIVGLNPNINKTSFKGNNDNLSSDTMKYENLVFENERLASKELAYATKATAI